MTPLESPVHQPLPSGPLTLHGRIAEASNGTFLGSLDDEDGTPVLVVYKPIRGERPLWDFPGAVLAHREYAAHLVSHALGWDVVPRTELREGPHGPGMVQRWCEPSEGVHPVDVLPAGPVPPGYLHVFDGTGVGEQPVQLVHEDTPPLLRMAVFDVLVNNADRKGGHVLAQPDGSRLGVDHGIAFHADPKLRTVLWGWAGQPVPEDLLADVARTGPVLAEELERWISTAEVEAFVERCRDLVEVGTMPHPGHDWPSVPWPPF